MTLDIIGHNSVGIIIYDDIVWFRVKELLFFTAFAIGRKDGGTEGRMRTRSSNPCNACRDKETIFHVQIMSLFVIIKYY